MSNDTKENGPLASTDKKPEVMQEVSKVASNPKQSILILVVILIIGGYVAYTAFSSGSKQQNKDVVKKVEAPLVIEKPVSSNSDDLPSIPKLPTVPDLVEPNIAPPLIEEKKDNNEKLKELDKSELQSPEEPVLPMPVVNNNAPLPLPFAQNVQSSGPPLAPVPIPIISGGAKVDEQAVKRQENKRKSQVMLISNKGGSTKTPQEVEQAHNFVKRGNMELTLGKGKIIDAVLETAINSDVVGAEARAVISRDVFSQDGKVILIPKGSRVFGVIAFDNASYGRLYVTWTRIDLSNGYTINLENAIAVDNLGRKGVQGAVDNKIVERVSNSILVSALNMFIARSLDQLVKPQTSTQGASNIATATNIQNIVQTTVADTSMTSDAKRTKICTDTTNAITDKTSQSFMSIQQACNNANLDTAGTPDAKLQSIISSINSAVTALVSQSGVSSSPTQPQSAAKDAFTDITNTLKDAVIENQKFKPTTSIEQGSIIKIYVNKDYNFPMEVLSKKRY